MTPSQLTYPPVFSTPVRWVLCVLSWLAFGLSAYLAWHAVNESSVAGCGVGNANSCDVVLNSSWSKWFGVPVAVAGLACYASLAGLSVLLGLRNPSAGRWINTVFILLAVLAAAASAWFIGLQIFAIGSFCIFCLVTDICGIGIGAISLWCAGRWLADTRHLRRSRGPAAGLMALRTALPTAGAAARKTPVTGANAPALPTPSLSIALGGALAAIAALVGGQILNPAKTYSLQTGTLEQSVALDGSDDAQQNSNDEAGDSQPHVAMRIPSNDVGDLSEDAATTEPLTIDDGETPAEQSSNNNAQPPERSANGTTSEPATSNGSIDASTKAPETKRLVEFLDGKLTLDVYKHPLIGSPKAPHVIVEMLSYDCPHCRKMHKTVEKGLARYGNQVAIIVMPIPFEKGCNKLIVDPSASNRGACVTARLAIGIATIRPAQFVRFHNWLMSGKEDKPPVLEKILPKAYELVDRNRLRAFIRDEPVNKQIAQYVDLYDRLRKAPGAARDLGLPVQILGDKVLSGMAEQEDDVFKAWEEHLGIEPR